MSWRAKGRPTKQLLHHRVRPAQLNRPRHPLKSGQQVAPEGTPTSPVRRSARGPPTRRAQGPDRGGLLAHQAPRNWGEQLVFTPAAAVRAAGRSSASGAVSSGVMKRFPLARRLAAGSSGAGNGGGLGPAHEKNRAEGPWNCSAGGDVCRWPGRSWACLLRPPGLVIVEAVAGRPSSVLVDASWIQATSERLSGAGYWRHAAGLAAQFRHVCGAPAAGGCRRFQQRGPAGAAAPGIGQGHQIRAEALPAPHGLPAASSPHRAASRRRKGLDGRRRWATRAETASWRGTGVGLPKPAAAARSERRRARPPWRFMCDPTDQSQGACSWPFPLGAVGASRVAAGLGIEQPAGSPANVERGGSKAAPPRRGGQFSPIRFFRPRARHPAWLRCHSR